MKAKKIFIIYLIFLLYGTGTLFAQETKKIDSLKNELRLFDAKQKKLGANFSKSDELLKVKTLYKLAAVYGETDLNLAFDVAKEVLKLSQKVNYKRGIANSSNIIGLYYDFITNYPLAIKYFEKALIIKTELKDQEGLINIYNNIGAVYAKLANYPLATENLWKGLSISKKINNVFGIFGGYNNIGVLYNSQGKYDEALQNFFNCLSIQKKMKAQNYSGVIYQNIGDIYVMQNKLDEAIKYFKLGLNASIKWGDLISEGNNLNGLGKVYQKNNDLESAQNYFLSALKIRQKIDDLNGVNVSYITIGNNFYKQKNYSEALKYLENGLAMVKKSGELDLIRDAYKYISEVNNATKNYQLAYTNQVLFKKFEDSIFNKEKQKKLTEVQMNFEFKIIQETEKDKQDKKNIIAKKEFENQKTIKNYTFFGMGMLVIFMVILIVQRNKIAKIRRQKAIESERNRISRDLHDNLGAQLSTVRLFVSSLKNSSFKTINQTIDNSIEMLDNSIFELRKIMQEMSASVLLEKGYLVATEVLVNKINQLHLIEFKLSYHKIDERFNSKIEHNLFRVTQELINNTLKYANAKNVSIDLIIRNNQLVFMYEDDGIGIDLENFKKGQGFDNMVNRINSLSGNIEFDSMPNAGFRTVVEIPL